MLRVREEAADEQWKREEFSSIELTQKWLKAILLVHPTGTQLNVNRERDSYYAQVFG